MVNSQHKGRVFDLHLHHQRFIVKFVTENNMKTIKAIIMAIGIAMAVKTANAQDIDAMFQQALDYTGKEWCTIPLDEDYQEKMYTLLSENNGDTFAKIIHPEFGNEKTTMLVIANKNAEDAEILSITIGDEKYLLEKINKGQAADEDTYFAKFTGAIPSNLNMISKLMFNNMKSATLININRKFPSILEVYNIKVEIGGFTFTFSPEYPIK